MGLTRRIRLILVGLFMQTLRWQPAAGLLVSVTPRALGSAEATIAASSRGYSSSSSSSSPAQTTPTADGSLLLRPCLWPLPRSTRGVASFERPSLFPRSFSIGTRLRGAGSDSKMAEVQGEGGEETQDFAKAQRPNLDPDVGEYGKALADKAQRVRELLGEHMEGGVDLEVFESPPINYRMRAEFRIWHVGDTANFAIFDPATKKPVLIDQYPLASKKINLMMKGLSEALKEDEMVRKKLFQVEFVSTSDEDGLLCLVYKKKLEEEQWLSMGRDLAEKINCKVVIRTKGKRFVPGEDHLIQRYEVDGKTYPQWVTENRFSQSNSHICQAMLTWAHKQMAKEGGGQHSHDLIELYCGNGNFTLPLSALFRRVFATELDKYSVKAAVACAEEAGVSNVCLAPLSAEEATQAFNGDREFFRLKERGIDVGSFDCKTILVDPPRAGLDDASLSLTQKFDEVMYISCNPANLVRDLERMPTHKIVSAAVFDQFPWTQHAEVAVKLQRR